MDNTPASEAGNSGSIPDGGTIFLGGDMVVKKSYQLRLVFLIISSSAVLVLASGCNSSKAPSSYSMENPYPNPFSPQTVIDYSLEESCHVTLVLWNQQGQLVDTLVNEVQAKGTHKVDLTQIDQWGEMLPGVYFYKLEACGKTATKKLVIMK
jgi:hypothetical protein